MLINKILPTIVERCPNAMKMGTIKIQQDNAPSHIKINDPVFLQAVALRNLDIQLYCQLPNSPDLNVLDLGFFRSLQTMQKKRLENR
mmetsp:Transcript_25947/g.36933  ORF Transcript_25947/g.36933 Transcript_25947/m.36933 type:complete len:87 (+) Transcript_25947:171-431(+)